MLSSGAGPFPQWDGEGGPEAVTTGVEAAIAGQSGSVPEGVRVAQATSSGTVVVGACQLPTTSGRLSWNRIDCTSASTEVAMGRTIVSRPY